jgi:hypothetical protein
VRAIATLAAVRPPVGAGTRLAAVVERACSNSITGPVVVGGSMLELAARVGGSALVVGPAAAAGSALVLGSGEHAATASPSAARATAARVAPRLDPVVVDLDQDRDGWGIGKLSSCGRGRESKGPPPTPPRTIRTTPGADHLTTRRRLTGWQSSGTGCR